MRPRQATRALVAVSIILAGTACDTTPSPVPSTAPVQAAPNPRLVEFEGHIAAATKRQGQLVQELAKAITGSSAELRIAAGQTADWAAAELTWLEEHRPDACYQAAADAYRTGVRSILTSAAVFVAMVGAPSPPSEAEGQAAGQHLSDGTDSLRQAATLAKSARAACR